MKGLAEAIFQQECDNISNMNIENQRITKKTRQLKIKINIDRRNLLLKLVRSKIELNYMRSKDLWMNISKDKSERVRFALNRILFAYKILAIIIQKYYP